MLLTPDFASWVTATDPVAALAKRLLRAKFDPNSPIFEPDPQPVLQVWNSGRRPIKVADSVFARDFMLAFEQSINAPLRPRAGAVIRESASLSTAMHP
ncbi:MAG: hypothetical protein ABJE95_07740 [Byssovorax sp.]